MVAQKSETEIIQQWGVKHMTVEYQEMFKQKRLSYRSYAHYNCSKCNIIYKMQIRVFMVRSEEIREKGWCKKCISKSKNIPVIFDENFINSLLYTEDKEKAINGDLQISDTVWFKCDKGHPNHEQLIRNRLKGIEGCYQCYYFKRYGKEVPEELFKERQMRGLKPI